LLLLIPAGAVVTVPPEGGEATSVSVAMICLKIAVTDVSAVIVRQFEASTVAPIHESNCQPEAALGVKHTLVPAA